MSTTEHIPGLVRSLCVLHHRLTVSHMDALVVRAVDHEQRRLHVAHPVHVREYIVPACVANGADAAQSGTQSGMDYNATNFFRTSFPEPCRRSGTQGLSIHDDLLRLCRIGLDHVVERCLRVQQRVARRRHTSAEAVSRVIVREDVGVELARHGLQEGLHRAQVCGVAVREEDGQRGGRRGGQEQSRDVVSGSCGDLGEGHVGRGDRAVLDVVLVDVDAPKCVVFDCVHRGRGREVEELLCDAVAATG